MVHYLTNMELNTEHYYILNVVIWVMTQCSYVGEYHIRGTQCLHLQGD